MRLSEEVMQWIDELVKLNNDLVTEAVCVLIEVAERTRSLGYRAAVVARWPELANKIDLTNKKTSGPFGRMLALDIENGVLADRHPALMMLAREIRS